MFFKHILIGFIILGIIGFIYGDRIFYYQANLMIGWQYDLPAYEAYERIVHYYPKSPHREEAVKMMERIEARNGDVRAYLAKRDSGLRERQKERARRRAYH